MKTAPSSKPSPLKPKAPQAPAAPQAQAAGAADPAADKAGDKAGDKAAKAKASDLGVTERRKSIRPLPVPMAVETNRDSDWAIFQALISDNQSI